jgi:hypothetical protein
MSHINIIPCVLACTGHRSRISDLKSHCAGELFYLNEKIYFVYLKQI